MPMARVADANIEYYLEGSGPPLLLISGFTAQASGWNEPFVRLLHSHFQLIRYSHRGTGTSDRLTGDISLRDLADDAAGLLSALSTQVEYVGRTMFRRDLVRGARFFICLDASSLRGYGGDLLFALMVEARQLDATQCGLDG